MCACIAAHVYVSVCTPVCIRVCSACVFVLSLCESNPAFAFLLTALCQGKSLLTGDLR